MAWYYPLAYQLAKLLSTTEEQRWWYLATAARVLGFWRRCKLEARKLRR